MTVSLCNFILCYAQTSKKLSFAWFGKTAHNEINKHACYHINSSSLSSAQTIDIELLDAGLLFEVYCKKIKKENVSKHIIDIVLQPRYSQLQRYRHRQSFKIMYTRSNCRDILAHVCAKVYKLSLLWD